MCDNFFNEIPYPTAENTARNNNAIPFGENIKLKSLSITITMMPINDNTNPNIFKVFNFSFSIKNAKKEVKTGIVAIITEAIVGSTKRKPKFSPKKYKNGSKTAVRNNSFRCDLCIFSNFPDIFNTIYNIVEEISKRKNTVVIG